MERRIRWQVRFKTLNGNDAQVDIYEEGWNGGITELEPAESPFSTEEDSEDDFLKPVRTQTGYLRVVDNGDLDGLMPADNTQHYLELYINNKISWCGYMQADTFSEDWDITPLITEYPLISPLGVLNGIYLDQDKGMGVVKLAELLLECIEAAGVNYTRIYFPREVWYTENESPKAPFDVALSRQTFFKDNGSEERDAADWQRYDASTCFSFLEEFCKFWGWTLYERHRMLYFIGESEEYYETTIRDLKAIIWNANPSFVRVPINKLNLSSLPLDGDDNKKEILQGVNKVKITAKIDAVGTVVPSIDEGYMDVIHSGTENTDIINKEYRKVIAYKPDNPDVDMHLYRAPASSDEPWVETNYSYQDMLIGVGAMYVKRDLYSESDLKNKRNYNYKEGVWIKTRMAGELGILPSVEQARNMPILVMRSSSAAKYSNGAFVLSAQIYGYDLLTQSMKYEETDGGGDLEIKFRIGDKWWDGSGWSSIETWFNISIGNDDDSKNIPGKIKTTKTLEMPYNGADGYVMPINEDLSGTVELIIHATTFTTVPYPYVRRHNVLMYIDNLKVEYYKDDDIANLGKSDKNENVYVSLLQKRFSDDKELELKIASNNGNQAAYNTLSGAGRDIGELYFVNEGANMLAEQHLLGILKRVYGRVTEKLNIVIERSDLTPLMRLTRSGKEYRILSEKIEWADDSEEIMIENIPD